MWTKLLYGALAIALPAVASAALNTNADSLGPEDRAIAQGNDFVALFALGRKSKPKTEFETTDAYAARIAEEGDSLRIGAVRLGGSLALRVGKITSNSFDAPLYYEYDADRRALSLCLHFSYPRYLDTKGGITEAAPFRVVEKVTPAGTYVGRNAYGVSVRIRKQYLVAMDVLLPVASVPNHCSTPNVVTPEEAKLLLPGAIAVIVGHATPPFVRNVKSHDEATISEPVDQYSTIDEMGFVADELILVHPIGGVFYREKAPPPARLP